MHRRAQSLRRTLREEASDSHSSPPFSVQVQPLLFFATTSNIDSSSVTKPGSRRSLPLTCRPSDFHLRLPSLFLLARLAKVAKRAVESIVAALRVQKGTWLADALVVSSGAYGRTVPSGDTGGHVLVPSLVCDRCAPLGVRHLFIALLRTRGSGLLMHAVLEQMLFSRARPVSAQQ